MLFHNWSSKIDLNFSTHSYLIPIFIIFIRASSAVCALHMDGRNKEAAKIDSLFLFYWLRE
jgi:hypothetical protein